MGAPGKKGKAAEGADGELRERLYRLDVVDDRLNGVDRVLGTGQADFKAIQTTLATVQTEQSAPRKHNGVVTGMLTTVRIHVQMEENQTNRRPGARWETCIHGTIKLMFDKFLER